MAEFRQHVAKPPRLMMIAPSFTFIVGGAGAVSFLGAVLFGISPPILVAIGVAGPVYGLCFIYSRTEPHAETMVQEVFRRAGLAGRGFPPVRTRRTWAGEGNRYER